MTAIDPTLTRSKNIHKVVQQAMVEYGAKEGELISEDGMIQDSCRQLFESYENLIKNSNLIVNMYRNSGADYNDFGRYKSCANNDLF